MRCTRSPACVRFFLLARLSSGLGDRCRYPAWLPFLDTPMKSSTNPYKAPGECDTIPALPTEDAPPKVPNTLWIASKQSALFGLKWVTIVIAPVLLFLFIGSAGVMIYQFHRDPQIVNEAEFWPNIIRMPFLLVAAYLVSAGWIVAFAWIAGAVSYLLSLIFRGRRKQIE